MFDPLVCCGALISADKVGILLLISPAFAMLLFNGSVLLFAMTGKCYMFLMQEYTGDYFIGYSIFMIQIESKLHRDYELL